MSHCIDDYYSDYTETPRCADTEDLRCCACQEPIAFGHVYYDILITEGDIDSEDEDDRQETELIRCVRCQRIHEHLRTLEQAAASRDRGSGVQERVGPSDAGATVRGIGDVSQRRFPMMTRPQSAICIAIVTVLTMVAWHYTPWSAMGWWGPVGCEAALRNAGIWPNGCGPNPDGTKPGDPCNERK